MTSSFKRLIALAALLWAVSMLVVVIAGSF